MTRTIRFFAVWIPVAIAFSVALAITHVAPLNVAWLAGAATTAPGALLSLGVLALCARVPWAGRRAIAFIVLHVLGATIFSALWAATIWAQIRLFAPAADATAFVRDGVAWQFMVGVLVYAVVAGVTYARHAYRREAEQERAVARAEMLRLRAELDALRARLDPHFLFNVLQTVGALVDQPAHAHAALEWLSALLKRRLDATSGRDDDATLADELADVRDYCALERLRLGERLAITEAIDPATLDLTLPRFTLQPLVENAIRHGLAPRAEGGRLTLRSERSANEWSLIVADDDAGAEPDAVARAPGVGLSVTRERLRLRYGTHAALSITTETHRGFSVALRVPIDNGA